MISQLSEFVNKEGHSSFQRAANDVFDIIGGLMRVVNYAVYDDATEREIVSIFPNGMHVGHITSGDKFNHESFLASVNFDESYRKEVMTSLVNNINSLVSTLLESKVVDEEAVSFLSPVISVSTKKTTPLTAFKYVTVKLHRNIYSSIYDSHRHQFNA